MKRYCALLLLLLMTMYSTADPFNVPEFPFHDGHITCKPFRFVVTTFTLPCMISDFKVLLTPLHFTSVLAGDEQMSSTTKIGNYSASAWSLNNRTFLREVDYILKMKESVKMQEIQVMRNFSDGFSLTTYGVFSTTNGTFVLEHKLCGKETKEGFELTFMHEFTFTHDELFITVERYLTNLVYQLAGLMEDQCRSHRINITVLSINMSINNLPMFDDFLVRRTLEAVQAIESDGSMTPAGSVVKQYAYMSNWEADHNEANIRFTFTDLYYFDYYTLVIIGTLLSLLILVICCCALSSLCRKKKVEVPCDEKDRHPEISSPMPFRHPAIVYV